MHKMEGVTLAEYKGTLPEVDSDVFVAAGAHLIGDLKIGKDSSVWFNTVIRADDHYIRIGERTNIQDNSTVHITESTSPTEIGSDVTIGHRVILHGCTVKDRCLIGMGAIILDNAVIQEDSVVAAGSVVTKGKTFPKGSLIMGIPAKVVGQLSDEDKKGLISSAEHYVKVSRNYIQK